MGTPAGVAKATNIFSRATYFLLLLAAGVQLGAVEASHEDVAAEQSTNRATKTLPCEDRRVRFFTPDFSKKITCSHPSAQNLCSNPSSPVATIADQLCPQTCGRCQTARTVMCADAPNNVGVGRTAGGKVKTCDWIRNQNGKKACSGPGGGLKMVDAVCPATCGVCEGGGGGGGATASAPPNAPSAPNVPSAPNGDSPKGDSKTHPPAQIMLYFDSRYMWQGKPDRRSWCIECGDNCDRRRRNLKHKVVKRVCQGGDWITLAKCDGRNRKQHWVWDNGKIKPDTNHGLCLDSAMYLNSWGEMTYTLRTCQSGSSRQSFFTDSGYNTDGVSFKNRFEIYPRSKGAGYCVTQHHHPRCGEEIRHQPCVRTRQSKTSYWVADEKLSLCGHNLDC